MTTVDHNDKTEFDASHQMTFEPLSDEPLVTVLICNYNYARFIPKALASLQQQTYSRWQAIVCDDGSTDESQSVLVRLAAEEPRVKVLAKTNGGQCSTVNYFAEHLTGEVICFLDADDEFKPEKVEKVVTAFRQNPSAGVCTHYLEAIGTNCNIIVSQTPSCLDSGWLADQAFRRGCSLNVPVTSGMSFRLEVLRQLLPIPASLKTDADGYLFMAAQFLTSFCTVDQVLARYRVHGSNMGGLVDLAVPRLTHEIRLIRARSNALAEFLASTFPNNTQKVDFTRNPHLIQTVLKLRVFGEKSATSEFASNVELCNRHPSKAWRLIWRTIFVMPQWMRVQFLPAASRSYRLKEIATRMLSRPNRIASV